VPTATSTSVMPSTTPTTPHYQLYMPYVVKSAATIARPVAAARSQGAAQMSRSSRPQ
jgi:hypothetical protein